VKKKRLGVLAGAFNPVTMAHLALADAASRMVDEVVCAVPRVYPHKEFHGAALEDRIKMLKLTGGQYRVEITERGLFIDIARELRRADNEIFFICGRDAAERIIDWDYGEDGAIEKMLDEFSLIVAERGGVYQPPEHLRNRVLHLELETDLSGISSTEVRGRVANGAPWEHLVPSAIVEHVRRIYAAA